MEAIVRNSLRGNDEFLLVFYLISTQITSKRQIYCHPL